MCGERAMIIDNIIFDLDGTLVDSAGDIIDCLEKAYAATSRCHAIWIDKSFIGPPLREMITMLTPELDAEDVERVIRNFRRCYDSSQLGKTTFQEGASDLLSFLRAQNKKLFIVTNKPRIPTEIIIKNLKIDYVHDIITPDIRPGCSLSKPKMISYVKNKWNLNDDRTMMVGDTASDAYAARENRLISVIVLNGYGDRESIQESRPEYIVDKLDALKEILTVFN
jgi:phosphoglycolate phosphatase